MLPFGHIFPHPLLKDRYFLMFCYSNGDACRKAYKGEGAQWKEFDDKVLKSPPGNNGILGVCTQVPEICPPIDLPNKDFYVNVNSVDFSGEGIELDDVKQAMIKNTEYEKLSNFDQEVVPRAVLEHRGLVMAAHAKRFGAELEKIYVCGGGSQNKVFIQILSDIFQAEVVLNNNSDKACALGAIFRCGVSTIPGNIDLSSKIVPNTANKDIYEKMIDAYNVVEEKLMAKYARI